MTHLTTRVARRASRYLGTGGGRFGPEFDMLGVVGRHDCIGGGGTIGGGELDSKEETGRRGGAEGKTVRARR